MSDDRRPFRIETGHAPGDRERNLVAASEFGTAREREDWEPQFARIFTELADIRRLVQRGAPSVPRDAGAEGEEPSAGRLMAEIESIHFAISQTKREILSLQVKGLRGDASISALDELDAVVHGTEVATETILSSAENIEEVTGKLIPRLQGSESAMVVEVHKNAVRIFEACNFQDLTGQRIAKVVQVLHFIEERVNSMISIWGGAEEFSAIPVEEAPGSGGKTGDSALLNGPPLKSDVNVVSQDDIDSLFA